MKKAFTFLELVFVILVMGVLANFGTNFLVQTYTSYTASTTNNKMLANVELTLKQISNRLQYRIRSSVIARNGGAFAALPSAGGGETVIEWIGYDIDGWLGSAGLNLPTWSGFIDVDDPGAIGALSYLESPGTNTGVANAVIQALSPGAGGTGFANSAIFFTGANSDVTTDYGWDGVAQNIQSITAAHPIRAANIGGTATQLFDATAGPSTFVNTDIYENYKLAWTAYAISLEDGDGDGTADDLVLYYDYQPWEGEGFAGGSSALLLQNVDTFKFVGVGETIQMQVCVNDQDVLGAGDGGYSVCEEIAIF